MEFFGIGVGMFALGQVITWTALSVLFPAFWIWMLVDSILRDESEYPGSGENAKIVWILLLVFFQFVALFYFVMVYAQVKRSPRSKGVQPAQPLMANPAPPATSAS